MKTTRGTTTNVDGSKNLKAVHPSRDPAPATGASGPARSVFGSLTPAQTELVGLASLEPVRITSGSFIYGGGRYALDAPDADVWAGRRAAGADNLNQIEVWRIEWAPIDGRDLPQSAECLGMIAITQPQRPDPDFEHGLDPDEVAEVEALRRKNANADHRRERARAREDERHRLADLEHASRQARTEAPPLGGARASASPAVPPACPASGTSPVFPRSQRQVAVIDPKGPFSDPHQEQVAHFVAQRPHICLLPRYGWHHDARRLALQRDFVAGPTRTLLLTLAPDDPAADGSKQIWIGDPHQVLAHRPRPSERSTGEQDAEVAQARRAVRALLTSLRDRPTGEHMRIDLVEAVRVLDEAGEACVRGDYLSVIDQLELARAAIEQGDIVAGIAKAESAARAAGLLGLRTRTSAGKPTVPGETV